jgi:hypothetical protein
MAPTTSSWKYPQARNRLQGQSRQEQPLPAQHHEQQQRCPEINHPHDRRQWGRESADVASEMPAIAKATASRLLENLRVFEIGVPALVGCLLGTVGGDVIWFWSV